MLDQTLVIWTEEERWKLKDWRIRRKTFQGNKRGGEVERLKKAKAKKCERLSEEKKKEDRKKKL